MAGRTPRSAPYRLGVLYGLRQRAGEGDHVHCPWHEGTPEADANPAGLDEARQIWSKRQRGTAA